MEEIRRKKHFIKRLKQIRTVLLMSAGAMIAVLVILGDILGLIRSSRFSTPAHQFVVYLCFVGFGTFILGFALQVLIVFAVGAPHIDHENELAEEMKQFKPLPREDKRIADWLGANANKRAALLLAFWIPMFYLFSDGLSHRPDNYFSGIATLFIVYSLFIKVSIINFQSGGVLLESASQRTWHFGRRIYVPYNEVRIKQPAFMVGFGLTIYSGEKRTVFVNERFWNTYNALLNEIQLRIPPNQCKFFKGYQN